MLALALSVLLSAAPAPEKAQLATAGGISWQAPGEWTQGPQKPMRAATYEIPAAKGDAQGAELAVFYFGEGQGGTVDMNVQRWVGQFKTADGKPADKLAKTKKEKIAGFDVTTVDLTGTYGGSGMNGPEEPKPNYRLIGSIVSGPKGPVFFKLTGPAKTVGGAEKQLKKLLQTIKSA